jgi:KDO2-lipid IV(A) lauroyltransferase
MILRKIFARLPVRAAGRVIGPVIGGIDFARGNVVRRNLTFAFPELSRREVRRLRRRVFRNYGVGLLEVLQMGFLTDEQVRARVTVHGADNLRRALAAGRGVIGVSAHLGNWEIGMQAMPMFFDRPVTAVVKKFKSERVERWMAARRTRFGNSVIYKKGALSDMTRVVRQGGVLAILVDMARHKDGVDVEYFGHTATATPAPALLALRCRCPVIPAFSSREPDGRIAVSVGEPVEISRTQDLRRDLVENTQRITAAVEQAVRAHPEQWHWMMRRWKDHYPQLYT